MTTERDKGLKEAVSLEPMQITIDGVTYDVDCVFDGGYLKMIECGRLEFYVAEDDETAGQASRKYWSDMAENDPTEFACIVGEDTLIQWGMGRPAGPGSDQSARNLDEWLDICAKHPEEEFASYDGTGREVDDCGSELEEELGFKPTVAYRHN